MHGTNGNAGTGRTWRHARRLVARLACVGLTTQITPSIAAQSCTSSPAQIAAALAAAEANAEDDDIRIVAGSHVLTTPLQFSTAETNSIVVSGGWNAGCTLKNGGSTVLDGGSAVRILRLYSSVASAMTVTDLGFNAGRISAGSNSGAGLSVQTSGSITIERNTFVGNQSSYSTGGLYAGSAGPLTVRNNLLLGNSAPFIGAAQLICNGASASVTGNTIVGNIATEADANGGLHVGGGAHFTLGNNIIRMNSATDLTLQAGSLLLHNDVGALVGMDPDAGSTGNLDVDPGFAAGFLNLHLAADSPLVNAGFDSLPGGLGIYDAGGEPRRQGGAVDIGAYETDVLFYSGVEVRPPTWP